MKKTMLFIIMLVVMTISASAQIVVSHNTNHARIDMDGDGYWDTEVSVQGIPGISYMRTGHNFYNELGRIYVINQWKMYERMGVNPANYLPNPETASNFMNYAGVYSSRIMGGGMVAPMGGMVGMPGNASLTIGSKKFGVSLSVPTLSSSNMVPGYTQNASVGVRVNDTFVGASVPVTLVKGNKKQSTRTMQSTTTRTMAPQSNATVTRSNNVNTVPTRVVEMNVNEVEQMLNSGSYM